MGLVRDRRPQALGDFCSLPDDLLCSIIGSLPLRTVGNLACVSRYAINRFCLLDSEAVKNSGKFTMRENFLHITRGADSLNLNLFSNLTFSRKMPMASCQIITPLPCICPWVRCSVCRFHVCKTIFGQNYRSPRNIGELCQGHESLCRI